ncbi:glycoside hydrolase family 5 protein [Modestobacter sp. URMC 112]
MSATSSAARWVVAASVLVTGVALLGLGLALTRTPGDGSPAEPPGSAQGPTPADPDTGGGPITALSVQGNQVIDQDGDPVRLLGFNVSGTEYACIEGWGIFDGPDSRGTRGLPAMVDRMARWTGANTVRVPLNEQCWLGIGVRQANGGARYQAAIRNYVQLLRDRGFVVVLDLHRSAPGTARSVQQEQMPDRDHSLDFWREVATAYREDTGVVFDAFNEPWPFGESSSQRAWECWRDGGCELTSQNGGQTYTAAGMDEIVRTIRSTGAANVIALGGIHWAEVLDRWLEFVPDDPRGNLIASFHNYSYNRYCRDLACYDTVLAEVVAEVPLFAGEVGPDTGDRVREPGEECPADDIQGTEFSDEILDWLDAHGAGYAAWSWNAWGDCYALISDAQGTPTAIWGEQVQARLRRNGP